MMHARWLALSLAAVTGCASFTGATGPVLRPSSPELHVGALDERTRFELDDEGSPRARERPAPDDDGGVDTPKQQRRRKILYLTGLGAMAFGGVGFVAFGVGGRIVQAQLKNGYADGDITREREDQLQTTGKVMNGLAIGTSVVGLAGLVTAAIAYGIDHARCGELRPRRKECHAADASAADERPVAPTPSAAASTTPPADDGPDAQTPEDGVAPMGPSPAPDAPTAPPVTGPAPGPKGPSAADGR